MGFYAGLIILSTLSMVAALVLMGGSGWTFGSRLADFQDQLHVIRMDDLRRKEGKVGIDLRISNYKKVVGELRTMWRRTRSVQLTCSALAFLGGIAQIIASSLALSNCYKTQRVRVKCWLTVHLILFFLLIICLLTTIVSQMNVSKNGVSWSEKVEELREILKSARNGQEEKYDQICEFLLKTSAVFYTVVGIDIGTIGLVFFSVIVLMRSGDYEVIQS